METNETLAERLGNVSHFMKLSLADRLSIILAGKIRRLPQNTTIFVEDEPCAGMSVLLKGHVHICKLSLKGRQSIIAEIDPVIMFNEVALLDGGPNPYTAIATQDSLIWQISRESYEKLLERYARDKYMGVALGLLSIMAHRYRQLLDSYADLSFLNVPSRVAKLIYEISLQGQTAINRQEYSIGDMAARIASTPEAISRSLNILKCQGIIETSRTEIKVIKINEIAELAQIGMGDIFYYGHKKNPPKL